MTMQKFAAIGAALLALITAGCGENPPKTDDQSAPVRGLITMVVQSAEETTRRRYPGVLEPTDITTLSFEVAGKLEEFNLQVGQRVKKGDVLAQLDSTQFKADVESNEASVADAKARLEQDQDRLARFEKLAKTGAATRVSVDDAATDVRSRKATLTQADRALANAREDLTKTTLYAPFDGIINSVDGQSFQTVAVGSQITSVYQTTDYEVSFSVNFTTVSRLVVGTPAIVRLADDPSVELAAVVSELGERADTVSSFPVVVQLKEIHPLIRAGMAVEVRLDFKLPAASGFLIPVKAAIPDVQIANDGRPPQSPRPLEVFVFDADTSTVKRRQVTMAGIRENQFLVIDGLKPGERVATAGVTFLRDGMPVKLLETTE
ncbi:MAG: efflux RND transporter periplasmic adaptor subunit [Pseudomonadota bacterium]